MANRNEASGCGGLLVGALVVMWAISRVTTIFPGQEQPTARPPAAVSTEIPWAAPPVKATEAESTAPQEAQVDRAPPTYLTVGTIVAWTEGRHGVGCTNPSPASPWFYECVGSNKTWSSYNVGFEDDSAAARSSAESDTWGPNPTLGHNETTFYTDASGRVTQVGFGGTPEPRMTAAAARRFYQIMVLDLLGD